ncbi:MAG TPA: GNAT family N-acetyltransferase [Microbacterium sp.]|uniref:GNAT family N-acetyltransferase n=1 Tax=Microbacterium sp. TaxID=51671 RepID=UPI002F94DAA6
MGVTLRPLIAADAGTLASWATDPVFCAHAGWRLRESPVDAIEWWREAIARPDPKLHRLLVLSENDSVGYVDLYGDDERRRELGYLIGPSARWGRGLGTAAALSALEFGFTDLGLDTIWAEAVEANVSSVRILRRLAMRPVGVGASATFLGAPSRYLTFEISAHEWLSRQAAYAR